MNVNWNNVIRDSNNQWVLELVSGGIRCGSCKRRHANVDSVKACYADQAEARYYEARGTAALPMR